MNKTFGVLFIFISLTTNAQNVLTPKSRIKQGRRHGATYQSVKSISPLTAILLLKLKVNGEAKKLPELNQPTFSTIDSGLVAAYGIITKNQVNYVNAFIAVTNDFNIIDFASFGFLPGTINKAIITGMVPVENIEAIANHPHVVYFSAEEKARPAMDSARNSTGVSLVHQGYQLSQSYFGDGVVVGIVDIGLNYNHPNFYDNTGQNNFRIKRVWEQLTAGGPSPAGYSYGRELMTEASILNAQRDVTIYSHGTQVAGIAAGAGGGIGNTYTGVAPKADIVMVSTDGTPSKLLDGVAYIMNYAATVNKPCVVNLSWGSHIGPHDGTSAFDQGCDLLTGPGKIIVGAAGNQGADSIYLTRSYSGVDTSLFSFVRFPFSSQGTNGQTNIDIWGVPNQDFKVAVNIYNISTNQYEDNTIYYSASTNATVLDTLYDKDAVPQRCFLSLSTGINPLNNKPHVLVNINNAQQGNNDQYIQIEVTGKNTQTKAWAADGSAIFSSRGYGGNVLGGSTSSTMGELGGTGQSIISVGAYASEVSYTSLNGSTITLAPASTIGSIASFSSRGPTADGRTKPDITAPGRVIMSSVNRYDANYPVGSNGIVAVVTNNGNNWHYGASQGTSMSTPIVTGTVALWLQADRTLTPAQIKTYLKDSAITDAFTGTIPSGGSNIWGYGKVDAYRGLKVVRNSVVYTFTGNGNWNEPSNWANNIMPPATLAAGTIMIDHTAGGKCILNVAQIVSPNTSLIIKANKNLVVPGLIEIK
ncbi:MAG: S8 family serine peptidase [Ferruginibacter sp.]